MTDPLTKCPSGVRDKSPILDYFDVNIPYQDEASVTVQVSPVVMAEWDPVSSVYSSSKLTLEDGDTPPDRSKLVGWNSKNENDLRAHLKDQALSFSGDVGQLLPAVQPTVQEMSEGVLAELGTIASIYKKWANARIATPGSGTPIPLDLALSRNSIRSSAMPITSSNVSEAYALFGKLGLSSTVAWKEGSKTPSTFWKAMLEARKVDRNRIRALYTRILKGLQCISYIVASNDSYVGNKDAFEDRPLPQFSVATIKPKVQLEFIPGISLGGLGLPPGTPPPDPGEPPVVGGIERTPPKVPARAPAKKGLSGGEIAGIVVGGVAVLGLGAMILRRRSQTSVR